MLASSICCCHVATDGQRDTGPPPTCTRPRTPGTRPTYWALSARKPVCSGAPSPWCRHIACACGPNQKPRSYGTVQSVALDVVDDELAVQLHPARPDGAEVDADDLGVEVLVREVYGPAVRASGCDGRRDVKIGGGCFHTSYPVPVRDPD
jgi:hypothetical protein